MQYGVLDHPADLSLDAPRGGGARSRRAVGAVGAIPSGPRPVRADIFGSVSVNYKLFLNILGALIFAAFLWLSRVPAVRRATVRARPGLEPPS
jgi:hypothetical protein